MLANPFEKESKLLTAPNLKLPKSPKKLLLLQVKTKMIHEVELLRGSDCRLLQSKNYEVFFTEANKIPNILMKLVD
jgi:hypothetical protein